MNQIERDILTGLQKFADDLRDGNPIKVTKVVRHETPDGPMHTFTKAMMASPGKRPTTKRPKPPIGQR